MTSTFGPLLIDGQRRWRVDSNLEGRRAWRIYRTKAEGVAQIETLEMQRRNSGEAWLSLSSAERNESVVVWPETQQAGVSLRRQHGAQFLSHRGFREPVTPERQHRIDDTKRIPWLEPGVAWSLDTTEDGPDKLKITPR